MYAHEFAYWLQGYFELRNESQGLSVSQVMCIKNHLALVEKVDKDLGVFEHEIDKKEGDDQDGFKPGPWRWFSHGVPVLERGVKDPLYVIRNSETVSFVFNDQHFHVGVGFYDDGRPGEVFVVTGLVGSHLRLAYEAWARLASKALQRGVSMRDVVSSIAGTRDTKGWITESGEFDGIEAMSAWDALARVLSSYA